MIFSVNLRMLQIEKKGQSTRVDDDIMNYENSITVIPKESLKSIL